MGLKTRRWGYDGYGTHIIKTPKALNTWLHVHEHELEQFIIEAFQPFRRELALQAAINGRGEIQFFPLVEWQAQDAKCLWVKGPVKAKGLEPLKKKLSHALKTSGYTGLIAIELFETKKGLLINEVAPRVHNSGHYSIEAMPVSQFSAHLLAITGASLKTALKPASPAWAMMNLLGSNSEPPVLSAPDNAFVHWYSKTENRKGRKMGHLTTLGQTANSALKNALAARKGFKL